MIYYIANYGENGEILSPAGNDKSEYIYKKLLSIDNNAVFVSPSIRKGYGIRGYRRTLFAECGELIKLPGIKLLPMKFDPIMILATNILCFLFLISNLERNTDSIVLYNSPWLNLSVLFAAKVKRCNVFLEIEELYSFNEFHGSIRRAIDKWIEGLAIRNSRGLICSSFPIYRLLPTEKERVICYGNYTLEEISVLHITELEEITILYSGSVDKERGLFEFIDLLSYYSGKQKLRLLITGYGESKSIENLQRKLLVLKGSSNGAVEGEYLGYISKESLIKLLETIQICVVPQNDTYVFSRFAFPSKVLFFLRYGKSIIAARSECIANSPFIELVETFDPKNAEDFSRALLRTLLSLDRRIEIEKLLRRLDEQLGESLNSLLKENSE